MNAKLNLFDAQNAVKIGAITLDEIPEALEFFRIRQRLASSAEATVIQYLLDADIKLAPAQALVKNLDRYGLGAVRENAVELVEFYSDDVVQEIYEALKLDQRFYAIANILFFAMEDYWTSRAEESNELNFAATE